MKKLLFCILILLNSCSGPNDINLEVVDFNEFKHVLQFNDNKTYVINFWATWCAPCIKELPYFEKINKIQTIKKIAKLKHHQSKKSTDLEDLILKLLVIILILILIALLLSLLGGVLGALFSILLFLLIIYLILKILDLV